MKSDKLQNALGKVDPSLIARADATPKKFQRLKYIKIIAPIAAVLAVAICFGLFSGVGKITNPNKKPSWINAGTSENYDSSYSKFLLLGAEYPKMTKYPGVDKYETKEYEDWENDVKKQWSYRGAGENLGEFFKATVTEFLSGHSEENAIYSPLNVYFALAMLAEVTDGNSRAQILDFLDADSIEALRKQAHAIWNANYSDEGTVTSILSSSVWLDKDYSFNKNTLKILKEYYYSSIFEGDLGTEETNFALRSWLNDKTGGLVDKLSDIELDPTTIMTLASTIYFNAKWDSEFTESKTKTDTFHSPVGDIECDFMNKKTYMDYYWGEKFSAVYKNLENSGSMWFILPDEGVSIDTLLSDEQMMSFLFANKYTWKNSKFLEVTFSVPKFDVQSDMDLSEGLKNLGITDCFDTKNSNFSPVTDETMAISKVQHGAGVKIDEKGIIASAFTLMPTLGSTEPSGDKIDFILDRPFIFVITGSDGLPLFVGIVNHP